MNAQQIIEAHAKRMGLSADLLTEILLFHIAGELLAWADAQEEAERGSVWYTADAPDWLLHYLRPIEAERLDKITTQEVQ
jgi:hypothetical protein